MRLKEFIREYREEIDAGIVRAYGDNCRPTNDDERADWVRNDEGLYCWAVQSGVPAP